MSNLKALKLSIFKDSGDDKDEELNKEDKTEYLELSGLLEAELDEHFQDRAFIASPHLSDKSKKATSEERDPNDPGQDGCCYSGCPSCPWGYQTV